MEYWERGTTMSKNLKEKNKLFSAPEVKNKQLLFHFLFLKISFWQLFISTEITNYI